MIQTLFKCEQNTIAQNYLALGMKSPVRMEINNIVITNENGTYIARDTKQYVPSQYGFAPKLVYRFHSYKQLMNKLENWAIINSPKLSKDIIF